MMPLLPLLLLPLGEGLRVADLIPDTVLHPAAPTHQVLRIRQRGRLLLLLLLELGVRKSKAWGLWHPGAEQVTVHDREDRRRGETGGFECPELRCLVE